MSKPIVAVVGRPNVGKSTLFNRLARHRISIVDDAPGVTRDRIYADVEWLTHKFTLIDTGGIDIETADAIYTDMLNQAMIAMETADVILFLTDVKAGPTDADAAVADLLRRTKKPVVLAVNKADDMQKGELDAVEFYSLGLGTPIPISAGQLLGLGDLLDAVVEQFPTDKSGVDDDDDTVIKVAIVGKPNVGKSSLLNRLIGEDRSIVSDVPGTTRDAVDAMLAKDGREYLFIDTAGIRKKSKIKENIERYSIVRAIAAIERCDVCILVIDALEGVTDQDAKIAGIAHERGKAAIILTNKWDIIEKDNTTMKKHLDRISDGLAYMSYAPRLFVSAKTGQRVDKIFDAVNAVSENHSLRVQTGILNETLIEAMAVTPPPTDKGKMLKVYYITQVSVRPPTFVLFVNDGNLMHYSYERFIENRLRQAFGFVGTPIKLITRNKEK